MNISHITIESAEINVGVITNDGQDLVVLNTFDIKNEKLSFGEKTRIKRVSIPNFQRGMHLVLWLKSYQPKPVDFVFMEKMDILERVKAIRLEQIRLAEFGVHRGAEKLLIEVCRNCEE